MAHVFISYKREEQELARRLAGHLEEAGLSVWWDPKPRAGEYFDDAIEKAIRDAQSVVVLWSRASVASAYVKDEAALALRLGKLTPVNVDGVELPFRFQNVHTHRLTNWSGAVPGPDFDRLLRDIESFSAVPGVPLDTTAGHLNPSSARAEHSKARWRKATLAAFFIVAVGIVVAYFAIEKPFAVGKPDLCLELDGRSIDLNAARYHGTVGPKGVALDRAGNFATETVFSGYETLNDFGKILTDRTVGRCRQDAITMTLTLEDGSTQRYEGQLFADPTGKTGMGGTFSFGKDASRWSGWIIASSPH